MIIRTIIRMIIRMLVRMIVRMIAKMIVRMIVRRGVSRIIRENDQRIIVIEILRKIARMSVVIVGVIRLSVAALYCILWRNKLKCLTLKSIFNLF